MLGCIGRLIGMIMQGLCAGDECYQSQTEKDRPAYSKTHARLLGKCHVRPQLYLKPVL